MLEFRKANLAAHEINRPKFEFKYRGRRRGNVPKYKGGPSLAAKLTCTSKLLDFFNLMITKEFWENTMLKLTS